MIRRIGWLIRVPVATGLMLLLIVNLVTIGIRASGIGLLAPLPPGIAVDYSPLRSGISPLGPEFIRRILGDATTVADRRSVKSRHGVSDNGPPPNDASRVIDVHQLTNDHREEARQVPHPPFTARTDTSQATRSAEDPNTCGSLGGTVWYRYHSSITEGLFADTFGTPHSIALGVYKMTLGALESHGCDTDVEGNAVVAFTAHKGSDYYFQVASPAGGGPLIFNLELQGRTTLESVSASGEPSDAASAGSALSGNGRIVVFGSFASNIVPGIPQQPCVAHEPYGGNVTNIVAKLTNGTNPCMQLFARDRLTGKTVLVSASPDGQAGNSHTGRSGQMSDDRTQFGGASVSYNGRYVAFTSEATNLVAGDTNGLTDAFVRDLWAGKTERVSLDWQGHQMPGPTPGSVNWASISADGRFVVFTSISPNLLPPGEDSNLASDVFVRDRLLGTTTRVSVSSTGEQTELLADLASVDNHHSNQFFPMTPCISGNGRFVAFRSAASNLVPNDTNRMADIFVHDQVTHTTERVSVGPGGRQADLQSSTWPGCLSNDGRFVVFTSRATNLVDGDTNGALDVFVRDRLLGITKRVSVSSDGRQSETGDRVFRANVAVISANGRYVAFHSIASDLVEGDQNAYSDVFIHDMVAGTTTRVSTKPGGGEFGDSDAYNPSISADGRVVSFDAAPAGAYLRSTDSVSPAQVYVHERSEFEQ